MKKKYLIALAIFLASLAFFLFFCKKEREVLDYFLPLANSFLHGKISVSCALPLNELVEKEGKCFVVYPPAPAIALLPFALIFGTKLSQVYPGIFYASLAGAIFYLALRRLTKESDAMALSLLLLFGTSFFMTSLIGRTWYFAHVIAVFFMVLSILSALKKKAFFAGLFIALAGMSRIPMLFAFPAILYLLKPAKKDYLRFFIPYILIVVLYLIYNQIRFGSILESGYSLIPGVLDEAWYEEGVLSLSYIPRNLEAMFLKMPSYIGKFPWFVPSTDAMALWLTTPALVLLGLALKNRLSQVMILSFFFIMITNFMHGAVGFSQFGYRFALDGILLLIIALIPVLKSRPNLSYSLIALSILINFYAVCEFYLGYFVP